MQSTLILVQCTILINFILLVTINLQFFLHCSYRKDFDVNRLLLVRLPIHSTQVRHEQMTSLQDLADTEPLESNEDAFYFSAGFPCIYIHELTIKIDHLPNGFH